MLRPKPWTPSSGMSTLRAPLLEVKITALISATARKSRLHSSFCHAGSSRLALQQGRRGDPRQALSCADKTLCG